MKPLKVVISAFGPYAKEEVIDFKLLNGNNIFLITGATGAGKTTIFDAISYALFGEASGSTRENDSLRSDFAESNRLTYVELDFELRGEVYHIRRVPQQLKPKVKGEGFTSQSTEAELVLPDGRVKTGANNVTSAINDLLGITKDQFKQIVMLPQGEFKRLLTADSKEREVIFRKIFGTQIYEKIQSLLNDKSKELYKEIEKNKEKIKTNVSNIRCQESIEVGEYIDFSSLVEKISDLIVKDKNIKKDIDKNLDKIKVELEKLQKSKIQGENDNNLIKEAIDIAEKLDLILDKKSEIEEKEALLGKINKAKEIIYIEEEKINKEKNCELKRSEKEKIKEVIKELKIALEDAIKSKNQEEKKEDERVKLGDEIALLKEKKPKILEFDSKKANIVSLSKNLEENILKGNTEVKALDDLKIEKKQIEEEIKDISTLENKRLVLKTEEDNKENIREELRYLYCEINKLKANQVKYNTLTSEFAVIEKNYKESKAVLELKEEIYMKEQAGILANDLKVGIACPVCGSLEHPNPAHRIEGVPTEEDLKNCKNIFEVNQRKYNEGLMQLTKEKESIDSILKNVINDKLEKLSSIVGCEKEYSENTQNKILEIGTVIKKEIDEIKAKLMVVEGRLSQRETLEKRNIELDNIIKEKEDLIIQIKNQYTNIFANLKAEEEALKTLERDIPKDIRSVKELDYIIKGKDENLNHLNLLLKTATEKVNELTNRLGASESRCNEIEKNIEEIALDIEKSAKSFNEKMNEYNFKDIEEYNYIKTRINEGEAISVEVTSYKEELKSLKDRNSEIKEKTKNLKKVDIQEIDEAVKEKKNEEKEISKDSREIYSIISNNSNILENIKKIQHEYEHKEEEFKTIGELASLSNGRRSPYITFERFVLASYFQEIINAANIRLSKMTSERYILKRKEDKGKGMSQQGLDLDVFDNYTGKSRDVKTLSGGESFKASLSLALGLSDVVQANSGGISLDTIFIDEGFGSLDSESLENAINSLLELQKGGRLVGIISHVQELKERIDAKLEVKTSSTGSSTKFMVM